MHRSYVLTPAMLPHKIGGCVVVHTVTVTERASELGAIHVR